MNDFSLKVMLPDGTQRPLSDFFWPQLLLMLASLLLCMCMFVPFWTIRMNAPQYPDGLRATLYIDHVEGHVQEIDELNHYLGMPSLDEGGKLERKVSLQALLGMSALVLAGVFVHSRWAGVLGLPAVLFPWMFLADLQLILYRYGHSIDPQSALGAAVKPFTPPVLGMGQVGQFTTESTLQPGFFLAVLAACFVIWGLILHRRIYRDVRRAEKVACA